MIKQEKEITSIEIAGRKEAWLLLNEKIPMDNTELTLVFGPHHLKKVCLMSDLPSQKPKDERWLILPFSDRKKLSEAHEIMKQEPLLVGKDAPQWMSDLQQVLPILGLSLEKSPVNNKSTKARHKWTKEIKDIPFNVTYRGSNATVFWEKRQEMRILSGAKLLQEAPRNKDGSEGFAAKVGDKLRLEQADKIKDGYTTDDVVLKSVNEVGLFLYYGGTNGWLVLVDKDGKSIDEWTRA